MHRGELTKLAILMAPELFELGEALIEGSADRIKKAQVRAARKAKRLALKAR